MESLRLLVADDHEIVRKGLRSLLEAQPGWQVTGEASDGREAVEKAKELKPDVTVLDLVCRLLLEKKKKINFSTIQLKLLMILRIWLYYITAASERCNCCNTHLLLSIFYTYVDVLVLTR